MALEVAGAMVSAAIDRFEESLARFDEMDRVWLDSPGDRDLRRWHDLANDLLVAASEELTQALLLSGGAATGRAGRVYSAEPAREFIGSPMMLAVAEREF